MARHGKLTPNMAVSADGQSWIKAKKIAALSFPAIDREAKSVRIAESTPTAPKDEWYVLTRHGVAGPFSHRKLRKLARRGRIQANVAVSRDRVKWTKARRVPGIKFPDSTADSELDVPQPSPQRIAPRQTLLFPGHVDLLPVARPRQLTLFAVDAYPRPAGIVCQPHGGEDWPLFHWPPDVVQPRLFDHAAISQETNNGVAIASQPARQLELAFSIGDQPVIEIHRSALPQQLTLFAVDKPPRVQASPQAPSLERWPLFHWPPDVVQLRLFEPTNDDGDHNTDESSATAVATTVAAEQQETETIPSELSTRDTQRWLHANWDQLRKAEYIRRFGACSHVARPEDPSGVPVDVYVFPANQRRPVTTLVTSGMSNRRMPVPQGRCSPRAELVLYVNEVKAEYVNLLYFLAQIPLRQNQALQYGTSLHHGNPPRPVFPNSVLDGYVFMIPSVQSDFEIHQSTRIGDDSLQLLWVVPTTQAERAFLAKHGMARFCWLLDQQQHALVFDPHRRCYVAAHDGIAI